ncbi:MAG: peroxiredoxin [Methanoculleus sp.]|jgi:peroxiredoxin (alkyl hydroperoxide reductase subunit C)
METQEMFQMPVIGEAAPEFDAVTTHGRKKLSDYKGKWVILFSHPADFTPVCTTEFIAFVEIADELAKLNTQLIGLSIDSVHSHLAWVRNVKEKMGVDIHFPIIADLDMKVARRYGMIHPGQSDTSTIRTVFFIDDKGIMRAMLYYPMSNGRSMPEILRLTKALQTSDKHKIATPANWEPGDKVIVPAPTTPEGIEERMKEGYECKDWYLCFKDL